MAEPFQKRSADKLFNASLLWTQGLLRSSRFAPAILSPRRTASTRRHQPRQRIHRQRNSCEKNRTSKQVGVGGDINNALDTIIMRPPNLKIWAERVHAIQQGKGKQGKQVAGEKESTNLIGNEGPSLKRKPRRRPRRIHSHRMARSQRPTTPCGIRCWF